METIKQTIGGIMESKKTTLGLAFKTSIPSRWGMLWATAYGIIFYELFGTLAELGGWTEQTGAWFAPNSHPVDSEETAELFKQVVEAARKSKPD